MIQNCRPHLVRDFELVSPEVVILVGGLAIKEVLGVSKLSEAVGAIHRRDGIVYVPLPHPSGASTWLNSPENKARLEESLAMLGEIMSGAGGSKENIERAERGA
jgi:uracil-DNA glycosylase